MGGMPLLGRLDGQSLVFSQEIRWLSQLCLLGRSTASLISWRLQFVQFNLVIQSMRAVYLQFVGETKEISKDVRKLLRYAASSRIVGHDAGCFLWRQPLEDLQELSYFASKGQN